MAAKVLFRPPVAQDIIHIARHMRQADRREVTALHRDVEHALALSRAASTYVSVAEHKGEPVAIFGLAPHTMLSRKAAPWLLGTDALFALRCSLARAARLYIGEALRLYPVLENVVDARNASSIALLRWLGFTIGSPLPLGRHGEPFLRFEITCASASATLPASRAPHPS